MSYTNDSQPEPSLRVRILFWWRRLVKPISLERRAEVQVNLREASHPDFSFFVLVVLSSIIATLGLLVDSPAIIIGAMLVAPLMSPVIGLGLSSITGDDRLLRDSVTAVLRGAVLAVFISFILSWINRQLPLVILQEMPAAVLSRTTPGPIDLGVALAGGAAAAFALAMPQISAALPGVAIATALMPPLCVIGIGLAMGRWDVAGGASLLFLTNTVTIVFAASMVFFSLGFREPFKVSTKRFPRSLLISALLTIGLLGSLSYLSYQIFRDATENRQIEIVVKEEVAKIEDTQLLDWEASHDGDNLNLEIVLRTLRLLRYEDSVALQQAIADRLQQPVAVVVSQIFAAQLDPLVPPTITPTLTKTLTSTPGPSPTPSATRTVRPTASPTPADTATPTMTPTTTSTPTSTPTQVSAEVLNTALPGLRLRQWPGGPEIGTVRQGQPLTVLYDSVVLDGLVWVEVEDAEGRRGWIPEIYILVITLTPTDTPVVTDTPTPTFSTILTTTLTISPTP